MGFLLLSALIVAQVEIPHSRSPNRLSVADVLDRWEAGAGLIETYDLRLELTQKLLLEDKNGQKRLLPESKAIRLPTMHSRIFRKNGKRRGEFRMDEHGHHAPAIIWDGKTGYLFQPGGDSVAVTPDILVFGDIEYEDYEATYHAVGGTADLIALSRARQTKLLPREGTLFVVDVPTAPPPAWWYNAHWRVWLNPDRNFMPVKLNLWFSRGAGEAHSLDIDNDLREVSPGVWAPVRSLIRVFYKDEKSPFHGKNTFICELKVIESQSKFNVEIPDSLFEVKIPNGMTVSDMARNAVYTQGSDNADRYLAQLAKDETKKLDSLSPKDRRPPETVFVPPDDRPRWLWPLLVGVAVLIGAGATYMARRGRTARGA